MRSPGMKRTGIRLLPVLLALCVLLLACGNGASTYSASTPTSSPQLRNIRSLSTLGTTTYLGTVPGTQAFIDLVINGQAVRAYVCDGTPTRLATLADWFTGQGQHGALAATSQDGVQLQVQITAQEALGTLTLTNGRTLSFTASFVPDTSRAGVYEGTALVNGQSYHAGWVVLQSGDPRGAAMFPSGPIKGVKGNIALVPQLALLRQVERGHQSEHSVRGAVVRVNAQLTDQSELVTPDPSGEGWMGVVQMSDPGEDETLMTAEQDEDCWKSGHEAREEHIP